MYKFYGQKVINSDLYISFNTNLYYKKVVCQKNKHLYYKYFTNDLFIVNKKINFLELCKLTPCTKNFVKVGLNTLSTLELEIYNIHCFIEKYLKDNNLNFYNPWWFNKSLNDIINNKLKCLSTKLD